MVYFQTKSPNLGKFWRALEWKILECFMVIWNTFKKISTVNNRPIVENSSNLVTLGK
jgi:hypothetical protein